MEGYGISTYGDKIAQVYDELNGSISDAEAIADFLAGLAGGSPALELAVGTGRIALPLLERGVEVHGIDASPAMVERLRAKSRGDEIPVTMGDFAAVEVDAEYHLIYLVFNTLFALTTQEDQIRCFANVARRLAPGGAFVMEAFVPDVTRFDSHQRVDASRVELDHAALTVSRHDPVAQRVDSNHIVVESGQMTMYPVVIRYAWPAELDLMARLAGLTLAARYAGWHSEPFTSASESHVSVYTNTRRSG